MSMDVKTARAGGAGILAIALIAGGGGYWLGQRDGSPVTEAGSTQGDGRKVLYWYDPMVPNRALRQPKFASSWG
jgi:Cu(I)/Ag(I) efflux system membrane fusion protein